LTLILRDSILFSKHQLSNSIHIMIFQQSGPEKINLAQQLPQSRGSSVESWQIQPQ